MKKIIFLLVMGLFSILHASGEKLVQVGENKTQCARCGMDLIRFYKTSHASEYKGEKFQYCSLHCLEDHLGEGIRLKNPKVVDNSSLQFISIADAIYVVGSKKPATMSRVSKYAFSNLKDAKKFQSEFGGEIMDFNGAREVAQKDFKHYR